MENWREKIGANYKIRDPLYGYIWLTKAEKKIIDTPLFQRLRRIHQLALTKYVYPTAEHSRFVHSLGAMHCATELFEGLHNNKDTDIEIDQAERSTQLKQLRFAALLHDLGHTAFSHASEEFVLGEMDHEALGQYIINKYKPIANVLDEHRRAVLNILSSESISSKYRFLHQIISGHLDADRADYLMRDSYACGVRYGEYDLDRYMQSFGIIDDDGEKLFINERDIYVVESFLLARHHYNMQVVYHRTRSGYDIVLNKFLEENLDRDSLKITVENGEFASIDLESFEWFDDYSIFQLIKEKAREGDTWARMLLRDGHLCPVFDTTGAIDSAGENYKNILSELKKLGLVEGQDFFKYKKTVKASKLTERDEKGIPRESIWVRTRSGSLHSIIDCSKIIENLTPVELYRIYTTPEVRNKAKKVCTKVCNGD